MKEWKSASQGLDELIDIQSFAMVLNSFLMLKTMKQLAEIDTKRKIMSKMAQLTDSTACLAQA